MVNKLSDEYYNELIETICKLDKHRKQDIVCKIKEQLANEFITDMNEYTYNRLNEFCKKYLENGSPLFLMKGKDFVFFPNDYTYEQHRFNLR